MKKISRCTSATNRPAAAQQQHSSKIETGLSEEVQGVSPSLTLAGQVRTEPNQGLWLTKE